MTGNILGIDVGTTSVKAAIIDPNGQVVARFAESYPTTRSHRNYAEQNPDDWVRLIDHALASFADHTIAAIGLCSQVNTHVFVDASGKALLPAILWQDGRAAGQATALNAQVSDAQKTKWWGAPMPIDASHAMSRMAWVAQNKPDIWEKTRWVMLPKDYCILALTGQASTDPLSNIGLVGADMGYIQGVLDLVPGASDKMAPLIDITQTVGTLKSGPFKGVPIVSGTMDAWAGLIGAGGAREGSTVYLSGTSEILGISSQSVNPTPGVIVFPQASQVRLHAAPTQCGGDAKLWFCDTAQITPADMAQIVSNTPRSSATPLFLPQLEGERAPLWNADLRGAFMGLTRQTGQGDLARAVYEGVALSARHALTALQTSANVTGTEIFCGGGGFQSEPWTQIRADVLGVPLRPLTAGEPGVLGAATLASLGIGHHASLDDAHAALAVYDATVHPNTTEHARYDTLYAVYTDAISAQADIVNQLADLHSSTPAGDM